MKIGGSTYCKNDLFSQIINLKESGYDFVEVDVGPPIEPNEEFKEKLRRAMLEIPCLTCHLPETDFDDLSLEKIKKFVSLLSKQNIHLFVFHLFSEKISSQTQLEVKINWLKKLVSFAKKHNSVIALENTEEESPTLKKVFDSVPGLYFCLDVGHASLFSKQMSIDLINSFSKELKHVHLHDNFGEGTPEEDYHLPIGKGKINFEEIITELKKVGYSGNVTLEIFNPDKRLNKQSVVAIKKLVEGAGGGT